MAASPVGRTQRETHVCVSPDPEIEEEGPSAG